MNTQLAPVDRAAMKTAFRLLVADVGGLEAAGTVTRLQKSALAECYDPHRPERMPPADVVADLESVGGQARVTSVLARIAGFALLPIGPAAGAEAQALVAVFRGASGVGEAWATAIADARVTPVERGEIRDRLLALQAACMQAVAVLEAKPKGDAA